MMQDGRSLTRQDLMNLKGAGPAREQQRERSEKEAQTAASMEEFDQGLEVVCQNLDFYIADAFEQRKGRVVEISTLVPLGPETVGPSPGVPQSVQQRLKRSRMIDALVKKIEEERSDLGLEVFIADKNERAGGYSWTSHWIAVRFRDGATATGVAAPEVTAADFKTAAFQEAGRPALTDLSDPKYKKGDIYYYFHQSDKKVAEKLKTHLSVVLRSHGLTLWDKSDISAGETIKDAFEGGLRNSKEVMIFYSASSSADLHESGDYEFLKRLHDEGAIKIRWIKAAPVAAVDPLFSAINGFCFDKPLSSIPRSQQDSECVKIVEAISRDHEED